MVLSLVDIYVFNGEELMNLLNILLNVGDDHLVLQLAKMREGRKEGYYTDDELVVFAPLRLFVFSPPLLFVSPPFLFVFALPLPFL